MSRIKRCIRHRKKNEDPLKYIKFLPHFMCFFKHNFLTHQGTIMTAEQNKIDTSGQASIQKELELDLDPMEPILPKKNLAPKQTLLEKAKRLFKGADKQNRVDKAEVSTHKEVISASDDEQRPIITETQEQQISQAIDPTISEVPVKTQKELKKPENWTMLGVLPPKYRRIFIALLVVVIILLIISWLKPDDNIEQYFEQSTGNSIPTQFQPLDHSQPVEPSILEQLKNPQPKSENITQNDQEKNMPVQALQVENEPQNIAIPINSTPSKADSPVVETSKRPSIKVEEATSQPIAPMEEVKIVEKNEPNKKAEKQVKAEQKGVPVVDAKPANVNKVTNSQKTALQKNAQTKTLVIPQGTSLMQVFRNNNLNIADVNAMTKASGAGNTLSSFKAGDKVQVSLNKQGRVNELRLSNGARFIRQADGSYQFKK